MIKKNYVSREEYEIWQYIKEKEIVDTDLVSDIFPEMPAKKKNKLLHNMHKKGYLKRARKGIYYNPEQLKSFYNLALRIKEGYIGLSSALRHYNLIEYEDFTIFVITKNFRKKIDLEGTKYEIQFIPLGSLFTGFEKKDELYVSSLEKTFFDCFLKPRLIGLNNITKAIYNSKLDWDKFIGFFKLTNNNALYQRTGYILDMMRKETKMKIPLFVFESLMKNIKNPVRLTPTKGKSTFNSKWKVQDNVGKTDILSWWY